MSAVLVTALALMAIGDEQVRIEVSPKFMEGVHFACEAAFDVVVDDTAYHQGRPVAVSGSFSLYYWPDQSRLFVGMKLGVRPEAGAWLAPADAYVVNGYRSNRSEQQAQSEAESSGFRLFVYDPGGPETVHAIGRLSAEGALDVAYTLEGGSMPMTFGVQLSDEQTTTWGQCVDALISRDG